MRSKSPLLYYNSLSAFFQCMYPVGKFQFSIHDGFYVYLLYTIVMNIGIDITPVLNQKAGISRYVKYLVENLLKIDCENQYLLYSFFGKNTENIFNNERAKLVSYNYPAQIFKTFLFLSHFLRKTANFLTKNAHVIHSTDFVLPASNKKPSVLTVQDLAFLHYPNFYTWKNKTYMKYMAKFSLKNADALITTSKNTRKDLINLLAIKEDKIFVIYPGVSPTFKPASTQMEEKVKKKFGLPQNYLLAVGTLEPRKNLNRLLKAFALLKKEGYFNCKLVIVGTQGWLYKNIFNDIKKEGLEKKVIFTGFIQDKDLPAVYSGASVFAYPSLYEGFGLPALEAMACGTPVVCSNTSSLPEVVGDAALTFNPQKIEQISEAIKKIIKNSSLAKKLSKLSIAQAKKFSWKKTAKETLSVYKKISN